METTRSRRPPLVGEPDELTSNPSTTSSASTIYYAPRNPRRNRTGLPRFPTPQIRPRQRRPHSIHVISYPPGYIPSDLRPPRPPKTKKAKAGKRRSAGSDLSAFASERTAKRVLEFLLAPFLCQTNRESSFDHQRFKRPCTALPRFVRSIPSSTRAVNFQRRSTSLSMTRSTMVETTRPPVVGSDSSALALHKAIPGIISTRSLKANTTSSVHEIPSKPIATGSGVSCSILLAEPNLFLTGFDHNGRHRSDTQPNGTALLRGKLKLDVSKNVKIKSVTLKFSGRARTEWPEGIPPAKTDLFEESSLRTQVLTFFHALHDDWETPYGNQCVATLKTPTVSPTNPSPPNLTSLFTGTSHTHVQLPSNLISKQATKELKRLSLQSAQSRSFNKDMSPPGIRPSVQVAKGFKVFHPGTYEYSFELPIDHHQLETTKLPFGSVKWELETIVERAGAFKPNLHGTKEVSIVRVPDQMSLETTEPIVIARKWENQLHYEIMISGKSFPVGSKIPIAFKLTPLAKVQVHKLKVFVTESVEYWTNDRKVTRKDQGRKILLLEKAAGKRLDTTRFPGCECKTISGGELSPDERQVARAEAARRRSENGEGSSSLPPPTDNLLGDLDLGLEDYWGSTEVEMNVQVPTCEMMKKDKNLKLNPDCSWRNVNVFHWIKIVMRISRLDEDDPNRQRRRHFEISIDSPITLLNCRATQANMSLPQYMTPNSPTQAPSPRTSSCGCPDAAMVSSSDIAPMTISTRVDTSIPRPIHFLRKPSFTPPAFDAEDPPPPLSPMTAQPAMAGAAQDPTSNPFSGSNRASLNMPLMTPPPRYDVVIGTPSVDGLADYFSRLANYEDDDSSSSDSGDSSRPARLTERSGRVNVANPMSPGGLEQHLVPSRSLELERPVILNLPQPRRRVQEA